MVANHQEQPTWEVEQKFRLPVELAIEERLGQLDAKAIGIENHVDTYLRHPCRDFRETDEALRIRSINGVAWVTYKGPRLAGSVKIRPEIELPLALDTADAWLRIWQNLGFVVAAQVKKERQVFHANYLDTNFVVALDSVQELGRFAELELIIHDLSHRDHAQNQIQKLAEKLGLQMVERRSYLGMLLALRGE